MYVLRGRAGVKSPIHSHCVVHVKKKKKKRGGVQVACKIAYVLNGRSLRLYYCDINTYGETEE